MSAPALLATSYATTLAAYLKDPSESWLAAAYDIGRQAVEGDVGVVGIVAIHRDAIRTVLGEVCWTATASQATLFLMQCLAPYEMASRGFIETNRELQNLNSDLERRVAERTRELESFSYSVAHDLRAPLRAIYGFGEILVAEHAAELGADAVALLHRITANAGQMRQLIDELLSLATVSQQELRRQPIAMVPMVRDVLRVLRESEPDRQIAVTVGELPDAEGDRVLIRQVWMNLLSNALKFTAGRTSAEIHIESEQLDNEVLYRVLDNGVGFDMAYAEKLFGAFERLHGDAFAGSGIGLAIVHRIVTRHGGQVWAEGKIDQGATFFFTLPVAPR